MIAAGSLEHAALIGAGATAVMDAWAITRQRLQGIVPADYRLIGRWIGHMSRGRFRHDSISSASSVRGERGIGWIAHYLIGMVFASVLLVVWGADWVRHPRLAPALIVGLCSVAAPFLLMQPGMGAGIAANRTADPWAARRRSLTTHAVFGVGLYAAGWVVSVLQL